MEHKKPGIKINLLKNRIELLAVCFLITQYYKIVHTGLLTYIFLKSSSYQFLDDAYRNHKQYLQHMTQQLQEKRKAIEEVSNYISTG